MKIADVLIIKLTSSKKRPAFPPGDRVVNPADIYADPAEPNDPTGEARGGDKPIEALYVEILSDAGVSGIFGPIQSEQAFVIEHFLKPFLLGKDPLATERLHDEMLRMNRHGRSGFFLMGVSVVDCALWDLKGKAWDQPVYRLLGGPTRDAVPAYASMLGHSIRPDKAAEKAREMKEAGYPAQKWFFRFGPADGQQGRIWNMEMAEAVRDAVGPFYPLMFDAFSGWTASYAMEMAKALAPLNPTWLEEPMPPERIGAFRKLRENSGIPIATGEHVYTRWQVKELLEGQAVDYIQCDPDWTGGISELTKIAALCSSYETPLVAHGHSLLPALHVAASQSPATVPYVEYLVQWQEVKQLMHTPVSRPENGKISLPELPGLGIVINMENIASWEEAKFKGGSA
ncbi:MAG: enolase C-terminal domain-like protein [Candidatus Sumerlaeia bacterium]